MEIVKAKVEDIFQIMEIKQDALNLFKTLSDPQWSEFYPIETDFLADIEKGELYCAKEGDIVLGFASITEHGHDEEYTPLSFSSLQSSLTFCRFAVRSSCRGKGVSQALFDFALKEADLKKKDYIVTDTHESNVVMRKFLEKNKFYKVDTLTFPSVEGIFIAFERKMAL